MPKIKDLFSPFELQSVLWNIEEKESSEYYHLLPESIIHPKRKTQRATVFSVLNDWNVDKSLLSYTIEGKPVLSNNQYISFSHKDSFFVGVKNNHEIGIDIERCVDKVVRIKEKFLHPDELKRFTNVEQITKAWTIKESVYKYFGKGVYSFKNDIFIQSDGTIKAAGQVLLSQTESYKDYLISIVYKKNKL